MILFATGERESQQFPSPADTSAELWKEPRRVGCNKQEVTMIRVGYEVRKASP